MLSNKVVVIIGGAGLIGRSFAEGLLLHGAIVIVADINIAAAQFVCAEVLKNHPDLSIVSEVVDMTSKESLQNLINRVCDKYGKVDAVINNAYPKNNNYGRKLELVEYSDFSENLSMHLGGYFLVMQQFSIRFKFQGFGNVINISSIYGNVAPRFDIYEGTDMTMPVEYAAIKSALQHLTIYFMRFYQGASIRFNCLSAGGILDAQPDSFLKNYSRYAQTKGMLDPSDLVGTLVYLVSDMSMYVNGQNIIVDDGWSA